MYVCRTMQDSFYVREDYHNIRENGGVQLHHAEQSDHLAEDLHMVCDDGLHGIIFRLKAVMPVFLEESFDGGGIFYEGYDDIVILSGRSFLDDHHVTVIDADVDHAVAFHMEHKGVFGANKLRKHGKVVFNVLSSDDRLSCSDGSHYRNVHYLASRELEVIVYDLNGSWLRRISSNIALAL